MKGVSFSRSPLLCLTIAQIALSACSFAGCPQAPDCAKVVRDLSYVTGGHERQKLDLYLPNTMKGPLIVWIHGGGWQSQTKDDVEALQLLTLGYTVASLDYRYSYDAIFPAQIEDCKAAIRWLRAHAGEYGYDPKRIGALGASAGGHLTALLATTSGVREFDVGANLDQSSAITCGIDMFGPTDLLGFQSPTDNPLIQRSGAQSIIAQLLGGPMAEKMDLARRASPTTWVTKESAPLYIIHGAKDQVVPLEQSQRFTDKLKAAGVDVALDVVDGGGHGGKEFWTVGRSKRLAEFLNRCLM